MSLWTTAHLACSLVGGVLGHWACTIRRGEEIVVGPVIEWVVVSDWFLTFELGATWHAGPEAVRCCTVLIVDVVGMASQRGVVEVREDGNMCIVGHFLLLPPRLPREVLSLPWLQPILTGRGLVLVRGTGAGVLRGCARRTALLVQEVYIGLRNGHASYVCWRWPRGQARNSLVLIYEWHLSGLWHWEMAVTGRAASRMHIEISLIVMGRVGLPGHALGSHVLVQVCWDMIWKLAVGLALPLDGHHPARARLLLGPPLCSALGKLCCGVNGFLILSSELLESYWIWRLVLGHHSAACIETAAVWSDSSAHCVSSVTGQAAATTERASKCSCGHGGSHGALAYHPTTERLLNWHVMRLHGTCSIIIVVVVYSVISHLHACASAYLVTTVQTYSVEGSFPRSHLTTAALDVLL